jgi:hypothetical protein
MIWRRSCCSSSVRHRFSAARAQPACAPHTQRTIGDVHLGWTSRSVGLHCGCHSRAGRPSPSPSWQSGVSLSVRWLLTLAFDHLSPHRIWLASVDAMPIKDHRIPMSASAICSKTTSRRASAPCASSLVCRACSRAWFTCWGRSCAISQSP